MELEIPLFFMIRKLIKDRNGGCVIRVFNALLSQSYLFINYLLFIYLFIFIYLYLFIIFIYFLFIYLIYHLLSQSSLSRFIVAVITKLDDCFATISYCFQTIVSSLTQHVFCNPTQVPGAMHYDLCILTLLRLMTYHSLYLHRMGKGREREIKETG